MPNVNYSMPGQNNTYGADTFNLGASGMYGQTAGGVQWDPQWQNTPPNLPGNLPNLSYLQSNQLGGVAQGQGGANGQSGTGYTIPSLVQSQLASNAQARQQNQQNWQGAANAVNQYTTPFTPAVLAAQQTQNSQNVMGQAANANRQQAGMMAADGQTDASSMAAANQANARNAMGALTASNQQLGINAAQANNQAGFQAANSVISHLPQYKPDDYSGLMSLTNTMQQQQQLNGMQANAQARPTNPMANGNWMGPGTASGSQFGGTQGGSSGIPGLQMVGNGGGGAYGSAPYSGPANPFGDASPLTPDQSGNQAWGA